jgi:hypothetical protein
MATHSSIVLEGVLKPDGTLELWSQPALPPGRVRVTLEATTATGSMLPELRPDSPWRDESVPAPVDLPMPSPSEPIEAREVAELLPEPFAWAEADARP